MASGLFRAATDRSPRTGAGGVALGVSPTRRLTLWDQADLVGVDGAGTSMVLSNETAFEAIRGLWLRVSPQFKGEAGIQPRTMRWALSAMLLPRTHVNLNATYYRDKPTIAPAVNTWLLQVHLYL